MIDRKWSWADSIAEVESRRSAAKNLVGERVAAVKYFDIDYRREVFAPSERGPREIEAAEEWVEPTWRAPDADTLDYGVELVTSVGSVYSVTWDPPGDREGIGIEALPLAGSALRVDADVAVWDVTRSPGWTGLVGRFVTDVDLNYVPWSDDGGYWCTRIAITFDGSDGVVFLLAEASESGGILRSSDNVVVLFGNASLPTWETQR